MHCFTKQFSPKIYLHSFTGFAGDSSVDVYGQHGAHKGPLSLVLGDTTVNQEGNDQPVK